MRIDEISGMVVKEALEVHRTLGPGLLESVYETLLADRLASRGLRVERQKAVRLDLEGKHFEEAFRVDLLVEGAVVVELKSTEQDHPSHPKQLLTYLKLLNLQVGLLINFGKPLLKDGLKRIVHRYPGRTFGKPANRERR